MSVGKASEKRRKSVGETSEKILGLISTNPHITIKQLAGEIGITERSIERNLQNLQEQDLLVRRGGRKEGYWELSK